MLNARGKETSQCLEKTFDKEKAMSRGDPVEEKSDKEDGGLRRSFRRHFIKGKRIVKEG